MTHCVECNGIYYISTQQAAKAAGYSSDYISRLAREKKVVAKRVGRQWFVDPISLENFSSAVKKASKIRNEKLSETRRAERQAQNNKVPEIQTKIAVNHRNNDVKHFQVEKQILITETNLPKKIFTQSLQAQLKSVGVLAAGFIVGVFMYQSVQNFQFQGDYTSIRSTLYHQTRTVAQGLYALTNNSDEVRTDQMAASAGVLAGTSDERSMEKESPNGLVVLSDTAKVEDELTEIREHFSDDITITRDSEHDDVGTIVPVFRHGAAEDSYRFLLVPINEKRNSRSGG